MDRTECRILLLNPPHTAIGSRVPDDRLPPLGLLSIGGPLLDAGFPVELLDAEFGPMAPAEIVAAVVRAAPRIVMTGHAGSTSAHPTVAMLLRLIRKALPDAVIVYGGVFPTYHWRDVLDECPEIDFIVRGEGERTAVELAGRIAAGEDCSGLPGIAWRGAAGPKTSGQAAPIADLDACRVGWELIDHDRYSYWGGRKAVVVQFSRGCPYLCSYCGQRGFWRTWRHRDPVRFARELARLHREHGVEVINFADELPTASRPAWQAFLEALIAEDVKLALVGSTRAGDIVRDADILHLYRKAGVIRFLLGIESYDEATLDAIRKDASPREDCEAIRLLRRHGIISMATYVLGFEEETDGHYWRSLRQLLRYDPDQIQLLYVTPHRWTGYFASVGHREVVQTDLRRWDYKHQVLATQRVPPWRTLLWVKCIEVAMQLRPRALARTFLGRDPEFGHGMRWYVRIGRRVWFREIWEFLFETRPRLTGLSLWQFWERTEATGTGVVPALQAPRASAWCAARGVAGRLKAFIGQEIARRQPRPEAGGRRQLVLCPGEGEIRQGGDRRHDQPGNPVRRALRQDEIEQDDRRARPRQADIQLHEHGQRQTADARKDQDPQRDRQAPAAIDGKRVDGQDQHDDQRADPECLPPLQEVVGGERQEDHDADARQGVDNAVAVWQEGIVLAKAPVVPAGALHLHFSSAQGDGDVHAVLPRDASRSRRTTYRSS